MSSTSTLIATLISLMAVSAFAQTKVEGRKKPAKNLQVLIDPGHGGIDLGGLTIGNTYEEPIVYDVSKKLFQELQKLNIKSEMIREPKQGLGLSERVEIALQKTPLVFVSIHANIHPDKKIRGTEFYIEPSDSLLGHQDFLSFLSVTHSSSNISDSVNKAYNTRFYYPALDKYPLGKTTKVIVLDMLRMKTRRESLGLAAKLKESWGTEDKSPQIREGKFFILRSLPFPSVLVELGYISNEKDFKKLNNEEYRLQLAKKLATGLSNYLNKTENEGAVNETE